MGHKISNIFLHFQLCHDFQALNNVLLNKISYKAITFFHAIKHQYFIKLVSSYTDLNEEKGKDLLKVT